MLSFIHTRFAMAVMVYLLIGTASARRPPLRSTRIFAQLTSHHRLTDILCATKPPPSQTSSWGVRFDLADANLAIDSACDFNGVVPIGRSSGINRFYYHSEPISSAVETGRKPSLIFSGTAVDGTSFGFTRRDCIDVFRQLIIEMIFCPEVDSMGMGGVGVAQHGNFSVTAGNPGPHRADDFRNMEPMQYWDRNHYCSMKRDKQCSKNM